MRVHQAAEDVAGGGADGNGGEKHRHHPSAFFERKRIGEKRRRDRSIRRFSNADRRARAEKRREAARESRKCSSDAPQRDANRNQRRPLPAIAEGAEERRAECVNKNEPRADEAELRIRKRKLGMFDRFEDRRDDEAIEIIEEIDASQNDERIARAANVRETRRPVFRRLHGQPLS